MKRRLSRREWLAVAALGAAGGLAGLGDALAAGSLEKGIYRVRGDVRVNGHPARAGMDVKAGDVVTTGPGAELVFIADRDAFLVREKARIEFAVAAGAVLTTGFRIVTGAVLSVFARGQPKSIQTPTATIGIRGTGAYVQVEPDRTYVCICYGFADIEATKDPRYRESIETTYHEQPRYVYASGASMMAKAPVINHSDAELILLEELVGRTPPFATIPGFRSTY